jgi:hypothetical protein
VKGDDLREEESEEVVRHYARVTPCPGSFLRGALTTTRPFPMLSLTLRPPSAFFSTPTALRTASLVLSRRNREIAEATKPTHDDTDLGDATHNPNMNQITDILDNAPQSTNFSSKPLIVYASQHLDAQCSSTT